MRKNQIEKTVLLPAIVVAGLLLLYFLPEVKIWGGNKLERVNILADIVATADTVPANDSEREYCDSVPEGITPIEDFSKDRAERVMDTFYASLVGMEKLGRPVRIAYFGDSFIEGDILTCDLREQMQEMFGGCGVGALNVTNPFKNSRGTVVQDEEGFEGYVSANRKTFKPELQGMNNFYATWQGEAWAKLSGVKNHFGVHLDKWDVSRLFFRPSGGMTVSCQISGGAMQKVFSGKSDKVEMVTVEGSTTNVKWQVSGEKNVCFFAANEGKRGIVVDNFAMRGANGYQHLKTPQHTLEEFAHLREYDLIIFQYGLNIAHPSVQTYTPFADNFSQIIRNFRKAWPKASIMLVSVSDRGDKGTNAHHTITMKGIKELVAQQRQVAKAEEIAFWNIYKVMADEGGIGKMAADGDANRDYVHLKFSGGKKLATKLLDALLNGKENYERRKGLKTGNK